MISNTDRNAFEIYIMDQMEKYRTMLNTAANIEIFSDELHQSLENAIIDMLEEGAGFNGINPDDYSPSY